MLADPRDDAELRLVRLHEMSLLTLRRRLKWKGQKSKGQKIDWIKILKGFDHLNQLSETLKSVYFNLKR